MTLRHPSLSGFQAKGLKFKHYFALTNLVRKFDYAEAELSCMSKAAEPLRVRVMSLSLLGQ